ncbi:MAG: hypothetical protein IT210_07125 [Armatimonadetes bacterium]|nr:hypothetical protein [Armatimonadota bacterium]
MFSPKFCRRCLISFLLFGLILCCAADEPAPAEGRPFWNAPLVSSTPDLQAILRQSGWPQASALTGFMGMSGGLLSANQPTVWLARSADSLYVAWRAPVLKGRKLPASATGRDGPVWNDDAIEFFIDSGRTHREYYQFIVNAGGVRYDGRSRDAAWNGDWQVSTAKDDTARAGLPRSLLKP